MQLGIQKQFSKWMLSIVFGVNDVPQPVIVNEDGTTTTLSYFSGGWRVGLLLSQDEAHGNTDDFDEVSTVDTNYTRQTVTFAHRDTDGEIIENSAVLTFGPAAKPWTEADKKIVAIGLWYDQYSDELPAIILPFVPKETVLKDETALISPHAIRLQLTNHPCNNIG